MISCHGKYCIIIKVCCFNQIKTDNIIFISEVIKSSKKINSSHTLHVQFDTKEEAIGLVDYFEKIVLHGIV